LEIRAHWGVTGRGRIWQEDFWGRKILFNLPALRIFLPKETTHLKPTAHPSLSIGKKSPSFVIRPSFFGIATLRQRRQRVLRAF
jgi:hypothetical protein